MAGLRKGSSNIPPRLGTLSFMALCGLAVVLLAVTTVWARHTTPDQARSVVQHWLGREPAHLGAALGGQIKNVQTFTDSAGSPAYYVVHLNPSGLVFLPADDLVEPIIGFVSEATSYDPAPQNPLGALVSRDIPGRVLKAREAEAAAAEAPLAPQTPQAEARRKWAGLANPTPAAPGGTEGIPVVSDVRVPSFVLSRWDQATADNTATGPACYNYFTPPLNAGNPNNYVTGCVATAMAQLMRYWEYPEAPVVGAFDIKVDGVTQSATIRGGDGSGSNYGWADMVLAPKQTGVNTTQAQAIGALNYDAGVSVNMKYTFDNSTANMRAPGSALVNTFRYANAKIGFDDYYDFTGNNLYAMVNPNLHARFPVILGIASETGGHEIICDGYGYDTATMYHHLNMGWSGQSDAWYNLPTINTGSVNYSAVLACIYNVYRDGSGEIIAGRVTDAGGSPISGALVSASGGSSATTDVNGIYALAKVPSNTIYTVSVSKPGYTFTPQVVATGASANDTPITGNVWGVDFAGEGLTLNQALDNDKLAFSTGGDANWLPVTDVWHYGGSSAQSGAIGDSQTSWLQTTVTGPGIMTFWFKVSSEINFDYLVWYLDGVMVTGWSGNKEWTRYTLKVPSGSHTIRWVYEKDISTAVGSDCGWVDQVVYTRGAGMANLILLLSD